MLADLYCAINKDATGLGENKENVDRIRALISGDKGLKITKLTFKGHNSSHGRYKGTGSASKDESVNKSRNKTLSSSRALTFKRWLAKHDFPMAAEADASKTLSETAETNTHKTDTVDGQHIKAWRSASVIIEYESSNVEDASSKDAEVRLDSNGKPMTDEKGATIDRVESVRDTDSISEKYANYANSPEGKTWVEQQKKANPNISERQLIDEYGKILSNLTTQSMSYDIKPDDKVSTVKRYDNEGEFFELLSKEKPFMHHLITDKIKYFDPAYHAISPEGFNARLTFLHQCTRQGATIGNSDPNVQTAYNLAFGRPPICVLRIGDFYYTKIVINSMTINYDDPQWDLNPEGIGVMPMFAKINLDFTFIGGSDLAGPIARLQNAVSFNYYANASVYDNRAERVEYDPTGTGKEIRYKPFSYPDELTRSATDDGMLEDI